MKSRWGWLLIAAVVVLGAIGYRAIDEPHPRYLTVRDAIRKGDIEDVRYHLSQGADLYELDEAGYSLLHAAALHERPEIAELLIARGLRATVRERGTTINNYAPLHLAARENADDAARVLLQAGADPNVRDKDGSTPLHLAAMTDSAAAALVLLDNGADANARNDDGSTPLAVAVRWHNERAGRVIVQHGGVK